MNHLVSLLYRLNFIATTALNHQEFVALLKD
jgi:hypothetical protein